MKCTAIAKEGEKDIARQSGRVSLTEIDRECTKDF